MTDFLERNGYRSDSELIDECMNIYQNIKVNCLTLNDLLMAKHAGHFDYAIEIETIFEILKSYLKCIELLDFYYSQDCELLQQRLHIKDKSAALKDLCSKLQKLNREPHDDKLFEETMRLTRNFF